MSTYHRDQLEPGAIHPATYVGTADPAATPANNVGPHKLWLDVTGGKYVLKKRNAGNVAWDIVLSLKHTDLTDVTTGDPHTQYLAKSLGTTKGDVLVYDGAAWVRVAAGADNTILSALASAPQGLQWVAPSAIAGAHVIQDNGVDMAQEQNLNFVGFTLADVPGTPGATRVTNPSMTNPMTTLDDIIIGGASGAATRKAKGTDGQVLTVDPSTHHIVWATPATPGTGTVTSVALTVPADLSVSGSPITSAGTLAVTRATQTANTVMAGPTAGGALAPTFRALVAADLPTITAAMVPTNLKRMSIAFQFGDGTNAIDASTEREQWIEINFDCTIEGHTVLADATGSIVIDLWVDTYANYPPTVADSICASALPMLSAAQKAQDTTLTGWTTAITRGKILKAHVNSAGTVKAVTLTLDIIKT